MKPNIIKMQIENTTKQPNPLSIIWNVVSTIGTILGLVSFADDLVTWKNIILPLLEGYRTIVHFPLNILQIRLNEYLIDYFFIGSLCGGSYYKAIAFGFKNGYLRISKYPTGVKVFYFILYLLFWPLGIMITLKQVIFKDDNLNEREIKIRFLQWLSASLIGFTMFLILNKMLPDKF